ncbi:HAD family hydrolase [Fervidobacterium sp.]
MAVEYVFLDYDGTIIENAESEFLKVYFSLFSKKAEMDFDTALNLVMTSVEEGVRNPDNTKTLYEKFTNSISNKSTKSKEEWIRVFYDFYTNEFDELEKIVKPNQELLKLIASTKKNLIFASNPLFPKIATYKRIKFAGLEPEIFYYIAHMENSTYAKPNPLFFKEILEKLQLKPSECVMIGDTEFDMACEKVGIRFIHVNNKKEREGVF